MAICKDILDNILENILDCSIKNILDVDVGIFLLETEDTLLIESGVTDNLLLES